jgi:hypothetical protein
MNVIEKKDWHPIPKLRKQFSNKGGNLLMFLEILENNFLNNLELMQIYMRDTS